MDYPVVLERDDNDTILVSFPDFPEVHTFGDNEEEALRQGIDALATGIDAYIKDRRDIPLPSATITKFRVTMPALSEAKIHLYEAMRKARVTKAELARRLDWHMPQVDRLLEMTHQSKLGQIEAAFNVLGKRLVVSVNDVVADRAANRRSRPRRQVAPARSRRATSGDRLRRK